ncbi:unnamed protein product, partial [Brassica oleracea]
MSVFDTLAVIFMKSYTASALTLRSLWQQALILSNCR